MTVKASHKVEQFYFVAKKLFWLQNIFLLLEPLKNCYKQKYYFSNKFDWLKYIDRFVGHFLTENTRSTRSHARGPKSTCSSSASRHWLVQPQVVAHSAKACYGPLCCGLGYCYGPDCGLLCYGLCCGPLSCGMGCCCGVGCGPLTARCWLLLRAGL